jgi:hypothetical protein
MDRFFLDIQVMSDLEVIIAAFPKAAKEYQNHPL